MYIFVDDRPTVTSGYAASFEREGVSSLGLMGEEFKNWFSAASACDLDAIQGFLLGDFADRMACASLIRRQSRAPIIALSDVRTLETTLQLFTAGIDDVLGKPVHVREILARSEAIWRRVNGETQPAGEQGERLKVHFDGRDPEVDGETLPLPRRERSILEYLVRNRGRRLTKAQIFNAIYGVYSNEVEESVVEGHVSKLRKKLRERLGYDPIEAKRYIGYTFVG
ncbi:two component transcriptional regulator, winged helix family [Methylobacterium sp. 4-46]|uniref:response regulator transcription factor n=1 Tax=unclassified Methylobacterium TaxID=2615210 RepID=UPI000165CA23|nr:MULTISPECIES: response regulator transcription factor [Methylobacterium]ACA17625.1 two component transcriptional regulator, winged helix family [Methylobacterium sp. 4-46]WFT83298.1 response regulator transcription factor [Methylobacterium nodulans]